MDVKTKKEAARVLAAACGEKRFFCYDGTICCNLDELAGSLEKMSADTFNHHVTLSRNDFSNWTRDVLLEDRLSSDLSEATNPTETANIVRVRITWLQKVSGKKA